MQVLHNELSCNIATLAYFQLVFSFAQSCLVGTVQHIIVWQCPYFGYGNKNPCTDAQTYTIYSLDVGNTQILWTLALMQNNVWVSWTWRLVPEILVNHDQLGCVITHHPYVQNIDITWCVEYPIIVKYQVQQVGLWLRDTIIMHGLWYSLLCDYLYSLTTHSPREYVALFFRQDASLKLNMFFLLPLA